MPIVEERQYGFWTKPRKWVMFIVCGLSIFNLLLAPYMFLFIGMFLKGQGWTEASRVMLVFAEWSNPMHPGAHAANLFRRSCLPHNKVPYEAQSQNIDAFNLYQTGKCKRAEERFEKLIAEYPNFEWPYNNLAWVKFDERKYSDALDLAQKAVAINPDYANAHFMAAQCLLKMGKTDDAKEQITLALELNPYSEEFRIVAIRIQKLLDRKSRVLY